MTNFNYEFTNTYSGVVQNPADEYTISGVLYQPYTYSGIVEDITLTTLFTSGLSSYLTASGYGLITRPIVLGVLTEIISGVQEITAAGYVGVSGVYWDYVTDLTYDQYDYSLARIRNEFGYTISGIDYDTILISSGVSGPPKGHFEE